MDNQIFPIDGNSGSQIINISIPQNPPPAVAVYADFQIICNPNAMPPITGGYITTRFSWVNQSSVVATPDLFIVNFDALPYTLPVSVLANDFDQEGGTLQTTANTLEYFGANGEYAEVTIDTNGFLTIMAWNNIGTNQNGALLEYMVGVVGSTAWTTSTVRIIKQAAGESFIYVRIVVKNQRTEGSSRFGDVFVETFRDPQCTQAVTVNNLTILFNKLNRTWVTGYSDNTVTTPGSIVMNNVNNVRIYTGSIAYNNRGGGSTTEFEIRPSGDYIKV
jgi:hypothetical protein